MANGTTKESLLEKKNITTAEEHGGHFLFQTNITNDQERSDQIQRELVENDANLEAVHKLESIHIRSIDKGISSEN